MSAPFLLKIITPTKVGFQDEVEYAVAPGMDGDFGVLSGHAPLLSGLRIGLLKLRHPDQTELTFAVGEGFCEVVDNTMVLITDFADPSHEINTDRALHSMQRAIDRLQDRYQHDVSRAEASLARARIRLLATGKLDHTVD